MVRLLWLCVFHVRPRLDWCTGGCSRVQTAPPQARPAGGAPRAPSAPPAARALPPLPTAAAARCRMAGSMRCSSRRSVSRCQDEAPSTSTTPRWPGLRSRTSCRRSSTATTCRGTTVPCHIAGLLITRSSSCSCCCYRVPQCHVGAPLHPESNTAARPALPPAPGAGPAPGSSRTVHPPPAAPPPSPAERGAAGPPLPAALRPPQAQRPAQRRQQRQRRWRRPQRPPARLKLPLSDVAGLLQFLVAFEALTRQPRSCLTLRLRNRLQDAWSTSCKEIDCLCQHAEKQ